MEDSKDQIEEASVDETAVVRGAFARYTNLAALLFIGFCAGSVFQKLQVENSPAKGVKGNNRILFKRASRPELPVEESETAVTPGLAPAGGEETDETVEPEPITDPVEPVVPEPVEPIDDPEPDFVFENLSPLYPSSEGLGELTTSEETDSLYDRWDRLTGQLKERLEAALEEERTFRNSRPAQRYLADFGDKATSGEPTSFEYRAGRFYREFAVDGILSEQDEETLQREADRIAECDRWLRKLGIRLIYCPTPNPLDADACRHLNLQEYRSLMPDRTSFLLKLVEQGVMVVDLRRAFGEAAIRGNHPFHRYDHHPSQSGLKVAAEAVAKVITGKEVEIGARFSTRFIGIDEPHISINHKVVPQDTRYGTVFVEEVLFDGEPVLQNPASPVLVMGDSVVLHLSRERSPVSADFTSLLAMYLGLPLRFHGRSGDPGAVPVTLSDYLAEGNPKPEFLVWIRDGAASASPGVHPDITFNTEGRLLPTASSIEGEHEIEIISISDLPDPETATYKDCLHSFEFRTTAAEGDAASGVGYVWGFRNRVLIAQPWLQVGSTLEAELVPYRVRLDQSPELDSVARTESGDFLLPRYFVEPVTRTDEPAVQ